MRKLLAGVGTLMLMGLPALQPRVDATPACQASASIHLDLELQEKTVDGEPVDTTEYAGWDVKLAPSFGPTAAEPVTKINFSAVGNGVHYLARYPKQSQ